MRNVATSYVFALNPPRSSTSRRRVAAPRADSVRQQRSTKRRKMCFKGKRTASLSSSTKIRASASMSITSEFLGFFYHFPPQITTFAKERKLLKFLSLSGLSADCCICVVFPSNCGSNLTTTKKKEEEEKDEACPPLWEKEVFRSGPP